MEIEEQHPIPQQVSAYQFKLVGDMTLQQFFQVAGGALVALLIYSSNLPSYVKWPLVLFSFLLGVALAFFPLEDRPLAKWIVLFAKAIYSPTIYVWKKLDIKTNYFQAEPSNLSQPATIQIPTIEEKKSSLQEESESLEKEEKKFLEKVSRDLIDIPLRTSKVVKPQTAQEAQQEPQVFIPQTKKVVLEPQEKKIKTPEPLQATGTVQPATSYKVSPSMGNISKTTQSAKFSIEAEPPLPPTKPNVVVGQVLTKDGKIVENAILEIKDDQGRAVRALRSNKLGHFMIVTPLTDGNYQIITEKEGLSFEAIALEAQGQIIPAISIWAKNEGGII